MNREERRRAGKQQGGPSVPVDRAREERLIWQLMVAAVEKPPGSRRAAAGLEARVPAKGGSIRRAVRSFHVDVDANAITYVETWDGVETSRRATPLPGVASLQRPGIFAPKPPPPGPAVPTRRHLWWLTLGEDLPIQEAVTRAADDEIEETGALATRLLLVYDEHVEELRVDVAHAAQPQGGAVATLAALAGRPGVRFRVLMGEKPPRGREREAFLVIVAEGDPSGAVWLGFRPFRLTGGRLATYHEWQLAATTGWTGRWDALPERLRRSKVPWPWPEAAPVPQPSIQVHTERSPLAAGRPVTATDFLEAVVDLLEYDAWTRGLDGLHVFVLTGAALERYVVRGEIPTGETDLVRVLASRTGLADAVATVKLTLFEDESTGLLQRAVITTAEAGGERTERILAMYWAPEARPDDPADDLRPFRVGPAAVGDDAWIGVPPDADIQVATTRA